MEVRITGISQSVRLDVRGRLENTYIIEYFVGDFGPFTEEMPKEGFTEAEARRKIEDLAREKAKLLGIE